MSKLKVTTIANVADSESTDVTNVINGSAKAWVNFNGTGTVAIRQSFNVSSITDNGTGDYTVNFTTALADANYSDVISISEVTSGVGCIRRASASVGSPSTSSRRFQCFNSTTFADQEFVTVAVFR